MLAANLGLLLTSLAWGTLIPLMHNLLQVWDPFFLSAFRYMAGSLIFILLLAVFEPRRQTRHTAAPWRYWLLGTGGIASYAVLFTVGLAHCHPVVAAILTSAGPIVTAIVGWLFYRAPIGGGAVLAILLAFAGGVLATWDPEAGRLGFDLRGGEALIVLAAACWAWYSFAAQRWLAGQSQLRITGMTMLPAGLVLIPAWLLAAWAGAAELPPAPPRTGFDVASLAWITLAAVVAAGFLWNFGVRRLGAVVASLFLNLIPIVAILITAVLGTPPTAPQIAGGLLVLCGVFLAQGQLGRLRSLLGRRQRDPHAT